jgi:DNA polymerase-4
VHRASPALALARFAQSVEREIGISVSIGLSYCKFLAKMASDLDKPRGFAIIGRAEARAFLAARPVGHLWGVGAVTEKRLAAEGFLTLGDIQAMDEVAFMRRLGASEAQRLWRLANGRDERSVSPDRETKSVSSETTFETDVADADALASALFELCEKTSARLKAQEIGGLVVTLKLKTTDFKLRTRSVSLHAPTQLASRLFEAARALLVKEADGVRFRLIGVGASSLRPAEECDRGDLADTRAAREKATENALDSLRGKFGAGAIMRGIAFRNGEK